MTIREIAKLADVSPSTVSRIINKKDAAIKPETRDRVLEVVERYQYDPLAKMRERSAASSRLIGIVVPSMVEWYNANVIQSLERAFASHGYNLIVSKTDADEGAERKTLHLLSARRVECILVMGDIREAALREATIPVLRLSQSQDRPGSVQIGFDYSKSTQMLMQYFFENNHQKIALLAPPDCEQLKCDYRQELERHQLICDDSMIFTVSRDLFGVPEAFDTIMRTGYRAILAWDASIAKEIYRCASMRRLEVGRDFSIAALDGQDIACSLNPQLTCTKLPFGEYANIVMQTVLKTIEQKKLPEDIHMVDLVFYPGASVTASHGEQKPHIAVIGAINMDVMMEVEHIPCAGETVIIREKTFLPGGKGANQAVGAAKLGARVSMIGKLGNDLYGKEMYHHLHNAGIDVQGIAFDDQYATGWAYIYVTDQAEYASGVHVGANIEMDCAHIDRFQNEILGASYCLVQTEIPMDTALHLGALCAKNHVRIILKPSSTQELPDALLRNIYMLVPNEAEINRVVPGTYPPEEKVDELLRRGTPRVVLTLGERGSYYADTQTKRYFPPAQVNVMDTMGASDAFISALAVYLAEGASLDKAITCANIAAGISVSQIGVQSALPERGAIEALYRKLSAE